MMKSTTLPITFHGKILDQLGYQAYQSPVEAISELVANAWDADATKVDIKLPDDLSGQITIADNGTGMTLDECEKAYLNIGYDKRGGKPIARTKKDRRIMGRKGIGKFAGLGIATICKVTTISASTGQKTIFSMDADKLRSDGYISDGGKIDAEYADPDERMKDKHGTTVVLKKLRINRNISKSQFPRSLARRFLVHNTAEDFKISVNGASIPQSMDTSTVEFVFPRDYPDDKKPKGLTVDGEWGIERMGESEIRWRAGFSKSPILDDDLQGITVFANGKLAQRAFFFNLTGALAGQHGQGYMFGQVVADFLEEHDVDVMSIDRQRIKWDASSAVPLLEWGRHRTKDLLRMWADLKSTQKYEDLKGKVSRFEERMSKLRKHERKTAEKTLKVLAKVTLINDQNYEDLAGSILTAFEGGRLQDLWEAIASKEYASDADLIDILIETDIVSALNVAEAIKTKILALAELNEMVNKKKLEKNLRDHIAKHPWIIDPKWDTYKRETRIDSIINKAADASKLSDEQYAGRVDLVLSSGEHLIVLEFMRPGLSLDLDHLQRCETYVHKIRDSVERSTINEFKRVTGYVVADSKQAVSGMNQKIKSLSRDGIFVGDWPNLISTAKSGWQEYLKILSERGKDDRLTRLANT